MYMLMIDVAQTSGFRDSLYYFHRNLLVFKLNATQPEKESLIEIGKNLARICACAASRSSLCTARSNCMAQKPSSVR
jgi:hypothetical protein